MTDGEALYAAILDDPADDLRRLVYADWLEEQGQAERAEFIRVQVEIAKEGEGYRTDGHPLHRRHLQMWQRGEGIVGPDGFALYLYPQSDPMTAVVRRGLVVSVRLSLAAWLEHGPALVAAHPIERVELSDVAVLAMTLDWSTSVLLYTLPTATVDDLPDWLRAVGGTPCTDDEGARVLVSAACLLWARTPAATTLTPA